MEKASAYTTIDEYINTFPESIQEKLQAVRETIRGAAPEAVETISYGMPAFKMKGILVYFAAFKNHIGFFPTASGVKAFEAKLSGYKCSKGTIQLPLAVPIPHDLIAEITAFRVMEDLEKAKLRKKK